MAKRRTGKQRAASRRNLVKARRSRGGDTLFGYFGRMALYSSASLASAGKAKPINDFIEGKGTPKQIRNRKKVAYMKRVAKRGTK